MPDKDTFACPLEYDRCGRYSRPGRTDILTLALSLQNHSTRFHPDSLLQRSSTSEPHQSTLILAYEYDPNGIPGWQPGAIPSFDLTAAESLADLHQSRSSMDLPANP